MCLFPREDNSTEEALAFMVENGVDEKLVGPVLASICFEFCKGVNDETQAVAREKLVQCGAKEENAGAILDGICDYLGLCD